MSKTYEKARQVMGLCREAGFLLSEVVHSIGEAHAVAIVDAGGGKKGYVRCEEDGLHVVLFKTMQEWLDEWVKEHDEGRVIDKVLFAYEMYLIQSALKEIKPLAVEEFVDVVTDTVYKRIQEILDERTGGGPPEELSNLVVKELIRINRW